MPPPAAPLIELRDAVVQQEERVVLSELSFSLAAGEFAYLIGRTGAGKSTLLKTLYGALPLKRGLGQVNGFDLRALDRRTIPAFRRTLGIVFQDFNLLYDRSVTANLDFVLRATAWEHPAERERRIDEVLEQVGLPAKRHDMPHQLSGGEQQRLVVARALLNRPPLLLADEPTGNLDPETADDIMQLVRELAEGYGMAVLFATHDYRIIEQFPERILRCQRGRVMGEGDWERV